MFPADADGVYARISAAPGRRWFAVLALVGLGGLIVALGLSPGVAPLGRVGLIAIGAATVWVADLLRRATLGELVLDADGLRDDQGQVLARMGDIVQVERGAFALKPSNGFTLVLRQRAPRAWVPGLWWRLGRRVGIGGVVSAAQAKFMAECIAMRLAGQSPTDRSG